MPKIVDHNARRQEIIAIARRLIVEGGFRAATMRSLAAEAGYANGALKHYFDSKDQIIEATFDSILDELDSLQSAVPSEPMSAFIQLRGAMLAPVPTVGSSRVSSARVLLALADYALESPCLHQRYQSHLNMWRDRIVELMEASRDEGSIRADANFHAIADRYMAMAVGTAVIEIMYPNGEKTPVFANFVEDTLVSLRPQSVSASSAGDAALKLPSANLTAEPDDAFFAIMSTTIEEKDRGERPAHRHDVMFSNSVLSDD